MSSNALARPRLRVAAAILAGCLSGCRSLVPYDSNFMCEKTDDYGRCMDVQTAYDDALAQESSTKPVERRKEKGRRDWRRSDPSPLSQELQRLPPAKQSTSAPKATRAALNGADLYRELEYRELAALIEQPVTPLVRPPKVLRTLIVSYTAAESLYMPRYVFYFAEKAQFVIGDYLNPADVRPTVYPNGRRAANQ